MGIPLADAIALIVSFCCAVYTLGNGLAWLNSKLRIVATRKSELEESLDALGEKLDGIANRLDTNEQDICALKASSVSRIKGKIVDRHKEYMALGTIDYRTLDYLQQQFTAYTALGGNSYVHRLIEDLEGLPLSDGKPEE